jgi:hypothetical protein
MILHINFSPVLVSFQLYKTSFTQLLSFHQIMVFLVEYFSFWLTGAEETMSKLYITEEKFHLNK